MGATERRTELEKGGRKQNFRERYKRGTKRVRAKWGTREPVSKKGDRQASSGKIRGVKGEVMLKDQSELNSS